MAIGSAAHPDCATLASNAFRTLVLACCLFMCVSCQNDGGESHQAPGGKPNIILFLVDDLRFDEVGYAGYPTATPNIDRLANTGVRFNNAFVTSSLCSPSRASFLTGVYPHTHGVVGNESDLDYDVTPTIATLLGPAGYTSAMIGKWHMGGDAQPRPDFDYWFALPGQGQYQNPVFNENGKHIEVEGYNTDIITEKAIEFISDNSHRSFYLHLSYKAVHEPFKPAARHNEALRQSDYDIQRPNSKSTIAPTRRQRAETLLAVDESVGRVIDHLAQKELQNTILIFTSDNGFMFGEHDRWDKRVFYEESIRIPWVVFYPGLGQPGSVISEPILNIDFVPSILEFAGVDIPEYVQGRSFIPLLKVDADNPAAWRDYWVYEYFSEVEYVYIPTHLAVIDDRYKYVRFPEGPGPAMFNQFDGEDLLFDLQADPYELNSIADSTAHANVLMALREKLSKFAADTDLRFFDLDPEKVNERLDSMYSDEPWFRKEVDRAYPQGYPGWSPPQRQPL